MRAPALLVALLLAGCADAPGEPPAGPSPPAAPAPRLAHLTSTMGLAPAPEDAEGAVRTGGFFRAWAEGASYVAWRTPAFSEGAVVDNLSVRLALRVTGPVVESARFPDVMVYGGSGESWLSFGSRRDLDSVLVPGRVYEIDVALAPPVGGLAVPAGETLGLMVVPVMHQNEAADVEVLVGGAAGSHANWTEAPLAAPVGAAAPGRADGEVVGSAYAGEQAPPSTRHRTAVDVPAGATGLLVWMNVTQHQGVPDVDLEVVSPDGEAVASSGTPTPREFARLLSPNLAGRAGEWTIVVTSYGSARATFALEWQVLSRA